MGHVLELFYRYSCSMYGLLDSPYALASLSPIDILVSAGDEMGLVSQISVMANYSLLNVQFIFNSPQYGTTAQSTSIL